MKSYASAPDAISDMHENGFTNDFQLYGNDLLWVQEGFFIRAGEFAIVEYHKVKSADGNDKDELIVFGILVPYHNIKGILLNHYNSYTTKTPPVLVRKINDWNVRNGNESLNIT